MSDFKTYRNINTITVVATVIKNNGCLEWYTQDGNSWDSLNKLKPLSEQDVLVEDNRTGIKRVIQQQSLSLYDVVLPKLEKPTLDADNVVEIGNSIYLSIVNPNPDVDYFWEIEGSATLSSNLGDRVVLTPNSQDDTSVIVTVYGTATDFEDSERVSKEIFITNVDFPKLSEPSLIFDKVVYENSTIIVSATSPIPLVNYSWECIGADIISDNGDSIEISIGELNFDEVINISCQSSKTGFVDSNKVIVDIFVKNRLSLKDKLKPATLSMQGVPNEKEKLTISAISEDDNVIFVWELDNGVINEITNDNIQVILPEVMNDEIITLSVFTKKTGYIDSEKNYYKILVKDIKHKLPTPILSIGSQNLNPDSQEIFTFSSSEDNVTFEVYTTGGVIETLSSNTNSIDINYLSPISAGTYELYIKTTKNNCEDSDFLILEVTVS
jgi:hypothetical protein